LFIVPLILLAAAMVGTIVLVIRAYGAVWLFSLGNLPGDLEYTPKLTAVNVARGDINNMKADYVHSPETATVEKQRVREAATTAQQHSNQASAQLRVDRLNIRDCTFAYTDKTAKPPYRVFFNNVSGEIGKFSNQMSEGPSTLEFRGEFMGSGNAQLTGTFVPETKKTNLRLNLAIENTQMTAMNDLFRSAGNFDIKSGIFSFYAQMSIQNGYIDGWVKPMFRDLKIAERQDKNNKNILHKAYVGTVKALAKVLQNQSKKQIATRTNISGPIENPNASLW
jgi:hypothetical protein